MGTRVRSARVCSGPVIRPLPAGPCAASLSRDIVPVWEHRTLPESSSPLENSKLGSPGLTFHPVEIFTGGSWICTNGLARRCEP